MSMVNNIGKKIRGLLMICLFVMMVLCVGRMEEVYAADIIGSGTNGTCSWTLDSDGLMRIFPTNGEQGELRSNTDGGKYDLFNVIQKEKVLKIVVEPGVKAGAGLTRMFCQFGNCTEMQLSNLDVTNVTTTEKMLEGNSALSTLVLPNFDSGLLTNVVGMFSNCSSLKSLDLRNFDVSNVTKLYSLFSDCSSLESLDISSFDTSKVTYFGGVFANCNNLKSIKIGENFSFIGSSTSASFQLSFPTPLNNRKWIREDGAYGPYTSSELRDNYSSEMAGTWKWTPGAYAVFDETDGTLYFVKSEDNNIVSPMTVHSISGGAYTGTIFSVNENSIGNIRTWGNIAGQVNKVVFVDEIKPKSLENWFKNFTVCESFDLTKLNTEDVVSMKGTFLDCQKVTKLDLSSFNTSKVTTMHQLFAHCYLMENVNLSSFDTSKVTNMDGMFSVCRSLKSLDVSNFKTENVTDMGYMFQTIRGVTELDLSSFDMSKVTYMPKMFSESKNISKIILGPKFTFKGRNIANTDRQSILLEPPADITTGKWIREDGTYGPYTPVELRDNYSSEMAGTWVWDVSTEYSVMNFDANGGYTEASRIEQQSPFEAITLPSAVRPSYRLVSWNTARDGSGTSYEPNSSYTPEGGKTVTFYAQWAEVGTYTVNYYQRKISLDGYDQVASETFYVEESKEVSPELREYEGFKTPAQKTVTVNVGDTVEVNYYYDRNKYAIHFDGNGADSGEMPDQQMLGAMTDRLLDNRFKKTNSWFSGWNTAQDGSGTRYGDAQPIKDIAGDGETFTLYAQWTDLSNASVEATEGKYIVQIEAGQTLTIPNLPAGTHYTIREVGNPDGWSQSGEVGVEGTIPANGNAHGVITNIYNTFGSFQLVAYKMMEIGELNEGDFTFELLNSDGEVIQTKANGSIEVQEEILGEDGETTVENPYYGMSKITFDDIQVTEPGDLTYRIREINGGSSDIIYDVHEENVVVHISDNHDGTLTCVPEYDSDGPVFINSKIPVFDTEEFGDLFISKQVSNMDESDVMFDFKVTLTDNTGVELTDSYPYDLVKTEGRENYKTGEVVTVSAVSHTENLDNMGEQNGNYGENWSNANIRGTDRDSASGEAHVITIPGAKSLHVSIVYGGESSGSASALQDYVCVWQGAHPTYTASVNASQSLVGKLGGGDHTNTDNIQEFDVQSNSVTFGYRSDGSECGDGYGYYAVVTGEVDQREYDEEYYISSGSITSGQTVQVGSGQTLVVEHLPEGVQYTVEELAKAGYEQTSKSGDTGVIPANSAAEAAFTNVYSGEGDAQIQMSKQLLGGTLAGGEFTFELRDSAGGVLQTKTNNAEGDIVFDAIHYTQADAGKKFAYSVNEVQGEGSYVYDTHIEDVTVDVADNGDGTLDVQIAYAGDAKFVNYASRPVVISKQDINGNEIAGAQLEITGRADGASADIEPIIWMSMEGVNKQVELAPGNYVLHEKAVPDSGLYVTASDISFRVEADGTVKVADESVEMVTMVDDYSTHSVVISKTDINGNEIEGAQLSVTGTTVSGEEIEAITWTSVEGQNKEISLQPGTYTLHETAVPDSDVYVLASDITFTVDTEGNVKVDGTAVDKVTMVDDYTPHVVKIKKVNPSSIAVIGANLRITGRETGSDVDIEAITWTTAEGDEEHEVQLKPGEYKLEETLVPSGYVKADDILFKVNADGSVVVSERTVEDETVIMTDAYDESGSLNITKTVRAESIDTEKGFEFLVTIEDEFADLNTENWKINGSAIGEVKVEEKDNSTIYSFSLVLKHGETAEITGLHIGSKFTVAETEESARGYSCIATGQTGEIRQTVSTAEFVNHYLGVLPATGFFNMNSNTRNIILAIIVGLVLVGTALYKPRKKQEK